MFDWLFGSKNDASSGAYHFGDAQTKRSHQYVQQKWFEGSLTNAQVVEVTAALSDDLDDAQRFRKLCDLATNNPTAFRKVIGQALTLNEYRKAVDEA